MTVAGTRAIPENDQNSVEVIGTEGGVTCVNSSESPISCPSSSRSSCSSSSFPCPPGSTLPTPDSPLSGPWGPFCSATSSFSFRNSPARLEESITASNASLAISIDTAAAGSASSGFAGSALTWDEFCSDGSITGAVERGDGDRTFFATRSSLLSSSDPRELTLL